MRPSVNTINTTIFHLTIMSLVTVTLFAATACNRSKPKRKVITISGVTIPEKMKGTPYDGIDISSHQAMVDWSEVSKDDNITFVYIKATEGATYSSPHYGYNVKMARQRGILVGSYHYFTTTSSVKAQFNNFITLAAASNQDLIPMIDVERRGKWSRKQLCDSVMLLAKMLEKHYGVTPMIYSTMAFYNNNLSPQFNNFHLYIGRYSKNEPIINWDGRYTIWQYSESGVVPGIDKYVDLCKFAGDRWLDDIVIPKTTEP